MSDILDLVRTARTLQTAWRIETDSPVRAVAVSPDCTTVAAALVDGPIVLVDAGSGAHLCTFGGHAESTAHIEWHPSGEQLLSCGYDGTFALWGRTARTEIVRSDVGETWCSRATFSPLGDRIVTAAGKTLRTWSASGEPLKRWPERSSTILDVRWRPRAGGPPCFAATSYGAVGIYDPDKKGAPARELRWKGSSLALAWSPTGAYLATGDQDSSVHFWIVRTGVDLQMSGFDRKVRELAWDRSGRRLATGGGTAPYVWNCSGRGPEGRTPQMLAFHEAPVTVLAYQSDGHLLASGAEDGTLAVWDPRRSVVPMALRGEDAGVNALAWVDREATLLVGRRDGTVAKYRIE